MRKNMVVLMILFVIVVLTSVVYFATDSVAQPEDSTMRGLIQTTVEQGGMLNFQFAEPIAPGQLIRDATAEEIEVGDDYVCFTEPWNSDFKYTCTPFSNVVTVTFIR